MKILIKNGIIKGKPRNLLIDNQIIAYIGTNNPNCEQEIDASGLHILPGIIDPHTHIRDLKQTDKETWTTASRSALKGGTTMVFDMPNTRPPTVNLEYLNMKREVAKSALINYKFNVAATAQNLPELIDLLETKPSDVAALKLFLAGSNSNEFVDEPEILKRIFDISLTYDLPLIVHTEMQKCVEAYSAQIQTPTIINHNFMRHRECSIKGTELMLKLAQEIGNKLYLAHISTAEELDLILQKKSKCRVYCEITPHHLLINEQILEKAGNYGKVNPPLRELYDNQRIMLGISDSTVDTIGTDHAPHTLSEKNQDYKLAPSGFPGLETSARLLLNEVNKGSFSLERFAELTSEKSAEIFNIQNRGKLSEGYFADLMIVDMTKTWTVRSNEFETKAKYSPYEGMSGIGDVVMTFVNGQLKYHSEKGIS